ncbi:flavin monoamine oxidase family protein [Streptomyces sp. NPDC002870]|uniref:flavin monoamine oxidase family protein n=1 Tax=Streptomyces sp. NPDC002870 TaxID=3364666 RepID=UPI0036A3FDCA
MRSRHDRAETGLPLAAGTFSRRPSRRTVLKAAGATAAAASMLVAGAPTALAETAALEEDAAYDVIVIGAGFTGVTAARELRAKGKRVLVLEARDRIGGRTWSSSFAGLPVEMGGTWVEATQPHIGAELKRYNIALDEEEPVDRVLLPTPTGPGTFTPDDGFGRIGALLERMFDGSRQYFERPFQPLYRADLLQSLDKLSLRDRLNQMGLSPAEELLINGQTAVYSGGSSSWGAFTMLAHWWSLAGWNNQGWNDTQRYRMKTGTSGLLNAMLNEAKPTVRLNSPVASVSDTGSRVYVTLRSGAKYNAPRVVVTVPVNVLSTIKFSPALPAAQTAAADQGIGVKNALKIWIHARKGAGRFYGQGAEGGSPIPMMMPYKDTPEGVMYVAFSTDPALDPTSKTQVKAAVSRLGADIDIIGLHAHDWGRDPYARGGWAFRKPGQLTSLYPAALVGSERVVVASGDLAEGWSGFIDGAVESGLRAAQQALGTK